VVIIEGEGAVLGLMWGVLLESMGTSLRNSARATRSSHITLGGLVVLTRIGLDTNSDAMSLQVNHNLSYRLNSFLIYSHS